MNLHTDASQSTILKFQNSHDITQTWYICYARNIAIYTLYKKVPLLLYAPGPLISLGIPAYEDVTAYTYIHITELAHPEFHELIYLSCNYKGP